MSQRIILLLLATIQSITACNLLASSGTQGVEVDVVGGTYTEIGVEELIPLIESDRYTLVNVHVPFEGDIPGTALSIPFDAPNCQMSVADHSVL